jgi:phosphoserine phosphatase
VSRLVVFDMDGVLADVESSWVYVHKRFGVNNDHSLYAYLRGEITDLEFIRRDIQLWKDKDQHVDAAKIMKILDEVPMMHGAKETVLELRNRGFKTAIVSAGIDLLADLVMEKLPFDAHLANGFETDDHGRLTGKGILNVKLMDKGEAVRRVAGKLGATKKDTVSVGNSSYDVSMFKESNLGIAFCPEDDTVRQKADAVVDKKDLTGILDFI